MVTTLVTQEELPRLEAIAAELGIDVKMLLPIQLDLPAGADEGDTEATRRGLEDLFNLY